MSTQLVSSLENEELLSISVDIAAAITDSSIIDNSPFPLLYLSLLALCNHERVVRALPPRHASHRYPLWPARGNPGAERRRPAVRVQDCRRIEPVSPRAYRPTGVLFMRNRLKGLLAVLCACVPLVGCAGLQGIQCDFAAAPIADCTEEADTYIRDSARVLKAPTCSKSTVRINKAKPREIWTREGESYLGTATDDAEVLACQRYRNVSANTP
jgi:hypothetical protein